MCNLTEERLRQLLREEIASLLKGPRDAKAALRQKRYRERKRLKGGSSSGRTALSKSANAGSTPALTRQTDGVNIVKVYEEELGILVDARSSDELFSWVADVGQDWVIEALKETHSYGDKEPTKRTWRYAQAILKRWKEQGKNSKPYKRNQVVGVGSPGYGQPREIE